MEPLVILGLVVLTLYVAVRLIATAGAALRGRSHKAYRLLATRYRGKYEYRGLGEPPTVSFGHKGSLVRVGLAPTVAGQAASPRTRVVARFGKGLPLRLELAPVARPAPRQPPKGTRPVHVGDPKFDRAYIVQANDADIAREFLGPSVRWAIENLRQFAPPAGMLLSINPERLLLQIDRNLATVHDQALIFAVRAALDLHDCLQGSVLARLTQGIEVVSAGPSAVEDAGPPMCKVCGDAIAGPHVLCVSCRTPHHQDCWTFVGGCSIFGCNGRECRAPG